MVWAKNKNKYTPSSSSSSYRPTKKYKGSFTYGGLSFDVYESGISFYVVGPYNELSFEDKEKIKSHIKWDSKYGWEIGTSIHFTDVL